MMWCESDIGILKTVWTIGRDNLVRVCGTMRLRNVLECGGNAVVGRDVGRECVSQQESNCVTMSRYTMMTKYIDINRCIVCCCRR